MIISFVIAVYNNEGAISATHEKIQSVFSNELTDQEYEIVFVDDGSKDGSLGEILKLKEKDPQIKAISFTRNFGQMAAMLAGFKEATGDAIINISADLQDPTDLIAPMVEKWKSGSKIVICYREGRSDTFFAKIFSRIAYRILRISLPQIPPGGFDFVLMDRVVMDSFNAVDVRHRFFQGDLLWGGYDTALIPYSRLERKIGKSQYNFAKKLKNFIDAVLDASYLPIRLISLLGIITSILGLLYAVTIVISWLYGNAPFQGWAPLMIVLLVVSGLIMVMLGIIGEYVWRINEEVRKRPNYIVKDKYL